MWYSKVIEFCHERTRNIQKSHERISMPNDRPITWSDCKNSPHHLVCLLLHKKDERVSLGLLTRFTQQCLHQANPHISTCLSLYSWHWGRQTWDTCLYTSRLLAHQKKVGTVYEIYKFKCRSTLCGRNFLLPVIWSQHNSSNFTHITTFEAIVSAQYEST